MPDGGDDMKRIEWHETYALGFPQLDKDHRRLLDLANEIIGALDDKDHEECQLRVEQFVEALRQHFPREERFLAEIEYPRLELHAGYHRQMLERAEEFRRVCERLGEEKGLTDQLEQLITALLADVRGGDLHFRTHLLEKGLNKALTERFGFIWL